MCLDCGCCSYTNQHGDVRHITNFNINGALDANGKPMTPAQMVQNIKTGLDVWLRQAVDSEDTSKSAQHELAQRGYRYSVSIEEV